MNTNFIRVNKGKYFMHVVLRSFSQNSKLAPFELKLKLFAYLNYALRC